MKANVYNENHVPNVPQLDESDPLDNQIFVKAG
jgi:hypothetical protein